MNAQAVIASPEPQPRPTNAAGGGLLLVVDDDPDVREVIAMFLREAGYVALDAGNGAEPLTYWRRVRSASRLSITQCR